MKGRQVRWGICALVFLGLTSHAWAQDFDFLRGSEPVGLASYTNWSGFYLGGQWGYSDVSGDFSKSTQGPLAYVLRDTALEETSDPSNLPVLGTADSSGPSYGGFIGYNSQWQNLILGVEANFQHTTVSLNPPNTPIVRSGESDGQGNTYTVALSASGSMTDLNYVALRGRAGLILGNFLPYGYIGAVLGVANVNVTATMQGVCQTGSTASCSPFSFMATGGENSALLYGGTVGAGLDYALTQNVFLRGEYEYTLFAPFANVTLAVSSIRVGAGLKF